jgi:tetratricopeptide (TPR) repeat protein
VTGQGGELSELLDRAERLRHGQKVPEGLELVGKTLARSPNHPRALLLQCRLLFELRDFAGALETLRTLSGASTGQVELEALRRALEKLVGLKQTEIDSAFATESMAELLSQQGYFSEAMAVYRRVYLASGGHARILGEIDRIKKRAENEGSRDKSEASLARELAAWESWLRERERGR